MADLIGLKRGRVRSRLNAEIKPGETHPSKLAVKCEKKNTTIYLWEARWKGPKRLHRRVAPFPISHYLSETTETDSVINPARSLTECGRSA